MKRDATFAYMLLSADWELGQSEEQTHGSSRHVAKWSVSDILEYHASIEEQRTEPKNVSDWPWHRWTDWISPVQFVLGWDPRSFFQSTLRRLGVSRFRSWQRGDVWLVAARDLLGVRFPDGPVPISRSIRRIPKPADTRRAQSVLLETLGLALRQRRGLLFVGCEGWSYHHDFLRRWKDSRRNLKNAGFVFVDRHA